MPVSHSMTFTSSGETKIFYRIALETRDLKSFSSGSLERFRESGVIKSRTREEVKRNKSIHVSNLAMRSFYCYLMLQYFVKKIRACARVLFLG